MAIQIDRWTFYAPAIEWTVFRFTVLLLILAGGLLYARRSASRIRSALTRLNYQPLIAADAASDEAPRIAEFEQARAEMQRLDAAQYAAQEAERSRIARELHDGLQQDLARLQIDLELSIHSAQANKAAQAIDYANKARGVAMTVIGDLHRIVNDLRPRALDELGLKAALDQLVSQFTGATQIDVELEVLTGGHEDFIDALPPPVATCLYRIAQECLNNIRKHADASFVHIVLDLTDRAEAMLQISDDGIGIRPAHPDRFDAHGLQGMTERAGALGGTLHMRTSDLVAEEEGTTVIVRIPLGV